MANEITSFQRQTACDLALSAYFSAYKVDGNMHFGTYGYQNGVHAADIYFLSPLLEKGNLNFNSESVFCIVYFNGTYYCSLEHGQYTTVDKAMVYRKESIGGGLFAWNEVYRHSQWDIMFNLWVHDGYLYASGMKYEAGNVNAGVVRTSNGTTWTSYISDPGDYAFFGMTTLGNDLWIAATLRGMYWGGANCQPAVFKNTQLQWLDTENIDGDGFWGIAAFNGDIYLGGTHPARIVKYEVATSNKTTVLNLSSKWAVFSLIVDTLTNTLFAFVCASQASTAGSQVWSTTNGTSWTLIAGTDDSPHLLMSPYYDTATDELWVPGGKFDQLSAGFGRIYKAVRQTDPVGPPIVREYVSQYPPAHNAIYVKARSWWTEAPWGDNFRPYFATDPALSVVGSSIGNSWASKETVVVNQRFHIDLGSAKVIKRIYYENYHSHGNGNEAGCKNFSFQGSNDAAAFAATLNFDDNTNWTDLTIIQSIFDQHVAANQADPKYIMVTNTTAYRYYAFKCNNNWGSTYHMGFRRIELQILIDPLIVTVNNCGHTMCSDNVILVQEFEELTYVTQYPPAFSDIYIKATSRWTDREWEGVYFYPWFSVDPYRSLLGTHDNNSWVSANGSTTAQRFHIDLGSKKIIRRILYNNAHYFGGYTERGVQNFTLWGSNEASAFEELTYGVDTGWALLSVSQNTLDQHATVDEVDQKSILVTNVVAYRYYAFKFVDARVSAYYMSIRRIELQTQVAEEPLPGEEPLSYTGQESDEPQIWTMDLTRRSAGDSVVHNPCGHWHKTFEEVSDVCLLYKKQLDADIGVVGPRSMRVLSDRYLYSFQNYEYPNLAVLKKIDSETLTVVRSRGFQATEIYKVWDIQEVAGIIWVLIETDGNYGGSGYKGTWIYRIDMLTFEIIDKRIYADTCAIYIEVEGSQILVGKYYAISTGINDSTTEPPTGPNWALVWAELPVNYAFHVGVWPPATEYAQPAFYRSFLLTSGHIIVAPFTTVAWGISKYTLNGEKVGHVTEINSSITNLVLSRNQLFAAFIITTDVLRLRVIKISDMSIVESIPTYQWNAGSSADSSSVIWHRNGFIYSCGFSSFNPLITGVIKMSQSGEVVASYTHLASVEWPLMGKIITTDKFVFWWQGELGDPAVGGIVKLDLNLNFICVEPFHFISADSPPQGETEIFQESAIETFALALREESRLICYHGAANHYTQWYYHK
uniref:F5/8 type C domain-containing protein n=1 Tax=viral metagenome TaxID=1070528 RepID=A0A6M3XLD9_9ZZZZ